ncbi:MAG: DsrE family protein [Chloroflexi bacterium]|nr:DsrE family protein [Chloroflexota bacterium]
MTKVAMFILSGVEDTHRTAAFHALLYARDLKAANVDVKLVFDGAGTGWIDEWSKPENRTHKLYEEVRDSGAIAGVCDFCVGHYGDKARAAGQGLTLLGESRGHPDMAHFVEQGYQVIVI